MSDYKHDIEVSSDKYFNDPDFLEGTGMDVCPVDVNYAFVPKEKNDPDNLKKAQVNIQKRFNLKEVE